MIQLENVARKERAPKEVLLGGAPKEVLLGGAPKEVLLGGALKEVPLGGQRITGAGFPYFAPKEVPLGDTSFHTGYACYACFQDAGSAEAFHHLRRVMPIAALREVQGVTEELPHVGREGHQVFFTAPDPDERFFLWCNHEGRHL